jgi:K+-sensing histidine kinase KdpD
VLPRIFDAFYADHEADMAKAGLGIGLWLTRNPVELHSGTISAKSAGGRVSRCNSAAQAIRLTRSRTSLPPQLT